MDYYEKYFDGIDKLINTFEAALPDDARRLFVKEMNDWGKRHPASI